jgi:hypothetical protein
MSLVDINEFELIKKMPEVFKLLLKDNSSGKNIIWATNNYSSLGKGYRESDQIKIEMFTNNKNLIKPRIKKRLSETKRRIREMAEVYTPAWICNKQNNLIDNEWFGYNNAFNKEIEHGWLTSNKVIFLTKNWESYIEEERMEIACGEAPYLSSRYDVVSGEFIYPKDRIGLLDRKIRVISENVDDIKIWMKYSEIAFKRIYGYEFQGDNVLLARENLLFTFIDYYLEKFNENPSEEEIAKIANIISWNIIQMDGLKFVVPNSCHKEKNLQLSLFEEVDVEVECVGCATGREMDHNGIPCKLMDWKLNKKVNFVDIIRGKD